jgi:hypothetical protein
MKTMQIIEVLAYGFVALVFITVFTWVFNFFMSPPLRENFQGSNEITIKGNNGIQRPYVTNEMDMGDFEGDFDRTMLNRFEGGIDATKDAQNIALRQFPFDWANAPPASSIFQEQNALFLNKENLLRSAEVVPGSDIDDGRLFPKPKKEGFGDLGPADDIIKTYRPQCASEKDSNKFSEDDSEDFILKYYDKQGLVPEVVKREDGVFEVVSTYEKNPKIVYEDELQGEKEDVWKPMAGMNEYEVTAQYNKALRSSGLDPAIAAQQNVGMQKQDIDSKGLERIFGPGLQWQQYG